MRVGLFFGSFNPFHNGHLAIVGYALEHGGVDAVWIVLSPHNPHKDASALASFASRAAYVERVVAHVGDRRVSLCRVEESLPSPSYTWDTLCCLEAAYPGHEFAIIMGGDSLASLSTWRNGERILACYPLLVYPRLGAQQPDSALLMRGNVEVLDAPCFDISSTFIRGELSRGRRVDFYLPVPWSI